METKTGRQIVNEFIESLQKDTTLDQGVVGVIELLNKQGKLTDKAITNGLDELRKKVVNENSSVKS
jgi:hypothetical protein